MDPCIEIFDLDSGSFMNFKVRKMTRKNNDRRPFVTIDPFFIEGFLQKDSFSVSKYLKDHLLGS
jgi:hypothetical protein